MKISIVPARNSLQWLRLGWQTFWRRPLTLGLRAFWLITFPPVAVLLTMVVTAQADKGQRSTARCCKPPGERCSRISGRC